MKWTEIPSGQTNGAFQRLMVSLGEQAEVVVTRINTEPAFVERLAKYAISGCIAPNASHDRAREIMGKNFFGIPEAIKHFGINPTRRQLAMLSEIPFTPEELMVCKDTHILRAGFPLSICDIRSNANPKPVSSAQVWHDCQARIFLLSDLIKSKTLFCKQDWYENQAFANDKGETSWQLILKTPVINSTNKNWDEQQPLITSDEEVPTAQMMVYTVIGHYLNTGERLFGNIYVRTSSFYSDGRHVIVRFFESGGLRISASWNGARGGGLGLSVARK